MNTVDTKNNTWCLYVIANDRSHSYVGITKGHNPDMRVEAHNLGKGAKRTRGQGPWYLIYVETGIPSQSLALQREREVKSDRAFRQKLKRQWSRQRNEAQTKAAT